MTDIEIELGPEGFVTVGTIGPRGQRVFHLQAGNPDYFISLVIEKEQAWALSEAITELFADLDDRFPEFKDEGGEVDLSRLDMDLREPITPVFRVAQMGLGYDETRNRVVLMASELVAAATDEDPEGDLPGVEEPNASVVRIWGSRGQLQALAQQARDMVQSGRPDPRQNGRVVYYWI